MTFVTAGLALAGVAAVAIPIIIFLLWRQRRQPVEFAAMRFLLEAFRKHRRRLQIEQLLLLAVRCLIPLLLGLALARPVLEAAGILDAGGGRLMYLVVDDGLVSGVRDADGATALDAHVEMAKQLITGLDVGDRVGLVTASRPARAVLDPPSSDHGAVVELLESMRPSRAPSDLGSALDRLAAVLDRLEPDHEQVFVYLLSDFRRGSVALDETLAPALRGLDDRIVLLAPPPAVAAVTNVQIASVEPARSLVLAGATDGSGQLTVRLTRQGPALDRDVSRVRIAGEGIAHIEPKVVDWQPGEASASVEFVLDFAAQRDRETGVTAEIEDDALPADNERHLVLTLRKQVRIVLLDRRSFGYEPGLDRLTSGQWIRRALAPTDDGPMDVVSVEPAALDEADLRTADVAVLPRPDLLGDGGWPILRRFVDRGGLLIVSPPDDAIVHRWTDHLRADLGLPWQIEREVREEPDGLTLADEQPRSALLRMVSGDLGELTRPIIVHRRLPVDPKRTQADPILVLTDGTPLVVSGRPRGDLDDPGSASPPSRGMIVYLTVAPQMGWTSLPGKPLMVPLWHELVRQGLSAIRSERPVGVGERTPLPVSAAATALIAPDGTRLELDSAARPGSVLEAPGLYGALDRAGQPVGEVAVNVDATSGRTDPQPPASVEAWLGRSGPWSFIDPENVGAHLQRSEIGSPIAGVLLLLVLGLVVLETLLARWFSHAGTERRASGARTLRPSMDVREQAVAAAGGGS
ncbi:MAG: VWA domain-containing protein [Planctomycetes bacterium]|nr:VWA domain-containing protein [Planctomycetota bacterium]